LVPGAPIRYFRRDIVQCHAPAPVARWRSVAIAVTLAPALFLALCPARLDAATTAHGWSTVALPLDRAAFARLLDLDDGLPRTVLLTEALRRLHDSDIHGEGLRARVVYALAAATPGQTPTATVPLPLTVAIWCALLGTGCGDANVVTRILADPAAGLLYLGLASTDEETRGYLAAHTDVLAWLKSSRPGTFAAFAGSLHIVDNRIVAPGGESIQPLWQALVAEPLTSPDAFIRRLLTVENGRYAYLFDTLAHLDDRRRRFALTMEDGAALITLGRLFAAIEPAWNVESRPFVRPFFDGATLLASMHVAADGTLAGPRSVELWSRVFDADDGDVDEEDQAALLDGAEVDAAWLIRALDSSSLRLRASRLQAILFGQRLRGVTRDTAADALTVLRAAIRMPALVLTLERMGVRDLKLTAALVRASRRLTSQGDSRARDRSLILWQGALAVVDRLVFMGRIDPEQASRLLDGLAQAASDDTGRSMGAVAAEWIRTVLLPAVSDGDEPATAAIEAERLLVAALGGLDPVRRETIAWEDAVYRVDPVSAERARLAAILSRMGGCCTLGQALEAAAIADLLGQGDGQRASAAGRLGELVAGLDRDLGAGGELEALGRGAVEDLEQATRELTRKQGRGAARTAAATIEDASGTMLAIALRRLVYATALGDPESQATLAGDVAARHTLGAERAGMPAGPMPQWALPSEEAASSRGWHVEGSLLGLDVALGRLWLRRVLGDMPFREPTLNESERQVLVAGLVLVPPAALNDGDRAAIVGALDRGRARVREAMTDATARAALCRDAGFCGWRNEVLAWASVEEPDALSSTISRTELARLGWSGSGAPPDAWGPLTIGIDGALSPGFRAPLSLDLVSGRGPLAQALGRFADLKLRIAELTAALGVPARLLPGVMASAVQDYMDEVRPSYPEDWPALLVRIDRITRGRVEDYVAALTAAGGPLVPETAPREGVQ
jgi:hypothetical protein